MNILAFLKKRWTAEDRIHRWLVANPGWHYGLDICKGADSSRGSIYFWLSRLEEAGKVERMDGAKTHPGIPRPLYRAATTDSPANAGGSTCAP